MNTNDWALVLVVVVVSITLALGIAALSAGDVGTFARQVAIGVFLLAFGVGLYRWW